MNNQLLYFVLGIGLVILGALLFIVALSKTRSVNASQGSVAVGNNNSGQIVNVNQQGAQTAPTGGIWLTLIAIVIEVTGIAISLFQVIQLTTK